MEPGPADTWGCAEHLSPPAAGWARLCTGGERPVWQTGWRAERAGASAVGPSLLPQERTAKLPCSEEVGGGPGALWRRLHAAQGRPGHVHGRGDGRWGYGGGVLRPLHVTHRPRLHRGQRQVTRQRDDGGGMFTFIIGT